MALRLYVEEVSFPAEGLKLGEDLRDAGIDGHVEEVSFPAEGLKLHLGPRNVARAASRRGQLPSRGIETLYDWLVWLYKKLVEEVSFPAEGLKLSLGSGVLLGRGGSKRSASQQRD